MSSGGGTGTVEGVSDNSVAWLLQTGLEQSRLIWRCGWHVPQYRPVKSRRWLQTHRQAASCRRQGAASCRGCTNRRRGCSRWRCRPCWCRAQRCRCRSAHLQAPHTLTRRDHCSETAETPAVGGRPQGCAGSAWCEIDIMISLKTSGTRCTGGGRTEALRAAARAAGAADVVAVHAEAHAAGGVEADGAGARRISRVATPCNNSRRAVSAAPRLTLTSRFADEFERMVAFSNTFETQMPPLNAVRSAAHTRFTGRCSTSLTQNLCHNRGTASQPAWPARRARTGKQHRLPAGKSHSQYMCGPASNFQSGQGPWCGGGQEPMPCGRHFPSIKSMKLLRTAGVGEAQRPRDAQTVPRQHGSKQQVVSAWRSAAGPAQREEQPSSALEGRR